MVGKLAVEIKAVDETIRRDLQFLARIGFLMFKTAADYVRKSWKLDSWPDKGVGFKTLTRIESTMTS